MENKAGAKKSLPCKIHRLCRWWKALASCIRALYKKAPLR